LLAVTLAHHGAPPDFDSLPQCDRAWSADQTGDPISDVAVLVDEARRIWPQAFALEAARLPEAASPFWHGFLGLLQLADWLGSDDAADAFPFSESGDGPRLSFARERARALIDQIGFSSQPLRAALPKSLDFSSISAFAPSAIQLAAADAPGPVVVLEAETGAGKTEAALWRFAHLFAEGKVDGLYFALPTRVAASQIHNRVQQAAKRLFGASAPEVLRALPGDVRMDDVTVRPLPSFGMQWNDDPDEATKRSRWAAEQPKRFLAATIAVGTVDQALLGAVCVKHAQMRSFCLSRSLLVVDEVHASDAYMETLLIALLEQHRRAGGEALLLSATLGAVARTRLLLGARKAKKAVPSPAEAASLSYPALAWSENGGVRVEGKASRGRVKTAKIEPAQIIAEPRAIAERALAAAESGARVLVVRNTVRDAVATARALEEIAPGHPSLFRLDGVVTLHHGRFARTDRWRLDVEVERRLGKDAEARPLVLIGTQTLEQSLDIDADFLITDLAPMDVLLQRIGRLHRHDRGDRPGSYQDPRTLVLAPDTFDVVLRARDFKGPHGFGTVYENLLSLAATRETVGAGATWAIPQMNRALVEAATHPAALGELEARLGAQDARWTSASMKNVGGTLAKSGAARLAAIDWSSPIRDFRLADERVSTRLGLGDIEIEFETPLQGPFPGSEAISRLLIPAHLLRGMSTDAKAVDMAACDDGFTFRLQDAVFRYHRYGLERI
jgi:CRISPR-associated endonuclease/helicase Cas3